MTAHWLAVAACRRAADRIRELAEAAYPGPWTSDESDDCWRLHSQPDRRFPSMQILKAPKKDTPYAEYWPDEPTGQHIVAWSPPPALAVAAFLEYAARDIEALAKREPDAVLPPLLLAAARMAMAFNESQPAKADDPEEFRARLKALKTNIDARSAVDGAS